jgi:hypothetical protein
MPQIGVSRLGRTLNWVVTGRFGGSPLLYILTFLACLNGSSTDRCRNVEIAWEGSPFQCMLFGQAEMARWIRDHPGYHAPRGYRCVAGRDV